MPPPNSRHAKEKRFRQSALLTLMAMLAGCFMIFAVFAAMPMKEERTDAISRNSNTVGMDIKASSGFPANVEAVFWLTNGTLRANFTLVNENNKTLASNRAGVDKPGSYRFAFEAANSGKYYAIIENVTVGTYGENALADDNATTGVRYTITINYLQGALPIVGAICFGLIGLLGFVFYWATIRELKSGAGESGEEGLTRGPGADGIGADGTQLAGAGANAPYLAAAKGHQAGGPAQYYPAQPGPYNDGQDSDGGGQYTGTDQQQYTPDQYYQPNYEQGQMAQMTGQFDQYGNPTEYPLDYGQEQEGQHAGGAYPLYPQGSEQAQQPQDAAQGQYEQQARQPEYPQDQQPQSPQEQQQEYPQERKSQSSPPQRAPAPQKKRPAAEPGQQPQVDALGAASIPVTVVCPLCAFETKTKVAKKPAKVKCELCGHEISVDK